MGEVSCGWEMISRPWAQALRRYCIDLRTIDNSRFPWNSIHLLLKSEGIGKGLMGYPIEQSRVQYVLLWRFYQTNSFSHPVRETPDIEHATENPLTIMKMHRFKVQSTCCFS